jgi:hypothetical protein
MHSKNTTRFGYGCPSCTKEIRDKEAEQIYLDRFHKVFNGRYKYKEFFQRKEGGPRYVIATCAIHGDFETRCDYHRKGIGCCACGHDKARTTYEEFIETSTKVHKGKYDYSKVVMEKGRDRVIIICPDHGEFEAEAKQHMNGMVCKKCVWDGLVKSEYDYIVEASWKHNNKYTYGKTVYNRADEKIEVTCPTHGSFFPIASLHLKGTGCPDCAESGLNQKEPAALYVYKVTYCGREILGFGISGKFKTRDSVHRKNTSRSGASCELLSLWNFNTGLEAYNIEQTLKKMFKAEPCDIEGFKTENTSIENLTAFESYIDSLGIPRETLDKS